MVLLIEVSLPFNSVFSDSSNASSMALALPRESRTYSLSALSLFLRSSTAFSRPVFNAEMLSPFSEIVFSNFPAVF